MRIIVLTAAALLLAGTTAGAQPARDRAAYDGAWYDVPVPEQRSYAPPATNQRPPFAAHVSANGQGID